METSSLRKAIIMEIILISAQELMSMSNSSSIPMKTYVVAYINPEEKEHILLEDLLKKLHGVPYAKSTGEPHGIINIGAAILNGMFHVEMPSEDGKDGGWPALETDDILKIKGVLYLED
ncbi:hypothetical protein POTOM_006948 [Populus tomentosa]|uniref:Uncharacterized protein n=1 Tax=Populus tomentosa TaxID=118781 RepID=A0A8X8APU1_POPTO|nr:hypothetical protein POTOM_006948 [Populus tomentosa]